MTTAPEIVLGWFGTGQHGLSNEEAARRLKRAGANILQKKQAPAWYLRVIWNFCTPVNLVLLTVAIIAVAFPDNRDWTQFGTVLIALIGPSSVTLAFELYKDGKEYGNCEEGRKAWVLRQEISIQAKEVEEKTLVPGDIVSLSAGAVVPADCMVLASSYLSVSQSRYEQNFHSSTSHLNQEIRSH